MPQANRSEEKVAWRSLGERAWHPEEQGTSGITEDLQLFILHYRFLSDKTGGLQ